MASPPAEFHVFILWHNGLSFAGDLLDQVQRAFAVRKACYLQWTPALFHENLRRFYSPEATQIGQKASVVGTGPFLAILVEDKSPQYELRQTTDGPRHVNAKVFDIKSGLRNQLPNKWLLHSSVTAQEGIKDSVLLFGQTPAVIGGDSSNLTSLPTQQRDLVGSSGYADLASMFGVLNEIVEYVVLIEDPAPAQFQVSDVEDGRHLTLLTTDHVLTASILNAHPIDPNPRRKKFNVRVGGRDLIVNIRDMFDGYLCPVWSHDILRRHSKIGEVRVPSADDSFYTSLYQICVHGADKGPIYDFAVKTAAARGLSMRSVQDAAYHCRKYVVRSAYSAPTPSDPDLPNNSELRRFLVRRAYIDASGAGSSETQKKPNVGELRAAIPRMLDNMISQLSTMPPTMHKHTEGWYESKVWRCEVPLIRGSADLCVKLERFYAAEMKAHAQHVAPPAIARLEGDLVPRFYGQKITGDDLILCCEWIDGQRLHGNIDAVVGDLVAHGELDAFIDAMHSLTRCMHTSIFWTAGALSIATFGRKTLSFETAAPSLSTSHGVA